MVREEEEKKENEVFEVAIRKFRLFLVEQLAKTQANIFILGLLVTFAPHRDRFLNIFSRTFVDAAITLDQLENMVGRIVVPWVIIFVEEEIPEGDVHNRALYISSSHQDMCIPLILEDNGSTLNICTTTTLESLLIPLQSLYPNSHDINAFDNTIRQGQRETDILLIMEGRMFNVLFQVLYIPSSFTILLGRP